MLSSGFWKCRVVNGFPSYIQSRTAANIRASPFGKVPVFCSRSMNSRLFTAAATASGSKPSRASCCNVLSTISSTFAEFSGATLSRPTLKTCCRSVSSRPPPMTWAPSPLSISAFCKGLPLLPRSRLPRTLRANFSSAVCASPGVRSHVTLQMVFLLMSESSRCGNAALFLTGLSKNGWASMMSVRCPSSKSARKAFTISSRLSSGSSP
mmetsp:Transcript_13519/g.32682  ORF Transcript_13519/g.32682 Transcript_13519/m.32682 type:complete len:209 (+) Transcript_13519:1761-2387(+)